MLASISDSVLAASVQLSHVVGAVPTPGPASMPPGFEKIATMMGWVKWLCLVVLIVSLMVAGARLGFGGRHGEGEEHAGRIGKVLMGAIVVSAAGALVGFLA